MYNTSAIYKEVIRSNSRPFNTVYGTITFTDGTTLAVDETNLVQGSLSISKQCADSEDLQFGGVFSADMVMSVLSTKSRYAFYGAQVVLTFKIQTGTEEQIVDEETVVVPVYEEIPLGVFTVSDADREKRAVKLSCKDNMLLLDTKLDGWVLQGTTLFILQEISSKTNYPLADSVSSFIETLPNYTATMQISEENGVATYRDAVKVVCTKLGCFAQDDRTGKMELRRYATESCCTLTTADWFSVIPADYITNYTSLSITGAKGTFVNSTPQTLEVGSAMVIEDTPAWDYGSDSTLQVHTDNLFNYLSTLDYTPCQIDMPNDPSFDCGDRLTLVVPKVDGTSGTEEISTLITQLDWVFHGHTNITSGGTNPYKSTVSSGNSSSTRVLTQQTVENKIQFYHFTNPTTVVVGEGETQEIASIRFSVASESNSMFIGTILIDVDVQDVAYTIPVASQSVPVTLTYEDGGDEPVEISSIYVKKPVDPDNYIAMNEKIPETSGVLESGSLYVQTYTTRTWEHKIDGNITQVVVSPDKVNYHLDGYAPDNTHFDDSSTPEERAYDKTHYSGQLQASIPATTLTGYRDGYSNVSVQYSLDDVLYNYLAIDKLCKGKHIITVQYPLTGLGANTSHKFGIHLTSDNGTVTVTQGTLRGTIFGQGLAESGTFMGHLDAEDTFPVYHIGAFMPWGVFSDDATVTMQGGISGNYIVTENGDRIVTENGDNLIT